MKHIPLTNLKNTTGIVYSHCWDIGCRKQGIRKILQLFSCMIDDCFHLCYHVSDRLVFAEVTCYGN